MPEDDTIGHDRPEEIERLRERLRELEAAVARRRQDQEASWLREASLRTLLDATDDTIALVAPDGIVLSINPSGARRLGGDAQEIVGKSLYALLPPEIATYRKTMLDLVFSSGMPTHFEDRSQGLVYLTSAYPVFDDKSVICVAVYGRDITERQRAEERLRRRMVEMTVLHSVARAGTEQTTPEAVVRASVDAIGRALDVSRLALGLLDADGKVLHFRIFDANDQGDSVQDLVVPLGQGAAGQALATAEPCHIPDVSLVPASPTFTPETRSVLSVPLRLGKQVLGVLEVHGARVNAFDEDDVHFFLTLARQIATVIERARLFEETQRLATIDALTGLDNRRRFFERATHEFARAQRHRRPLSALMVDVDHFKRANDTHGHAVGDGLLRGVAERVRHQLRQTDVVGRYGGEEFAIVLTETERGQAQWVAEQLRRKVAEAPFDTQGGPLTLTVSVGVASLVEPCADLDALLQRADQALYAAKHAGRDCVRVFEDQKPERS
jgi:diguanylate cyclase (GGDEF)-like protein/PAS domain S-box-containing protein